jgi:hypothetical protein
LTSCKWAKSLHEKEPTDFNVSPAITLADGRSIPYLHRLGVAWACVVGYGVAVDWIFSTGTHTLLRIHGQLC